MNQFMLKYSITVSARQYQDNTEEGEEDVSTDLVSHADAASALELALRYTVRRVMFMLLWRNIALPSRFSSLRQKKLTDCVPTY
ncbi:hypothetical protein AVEN_50670-1 [Araneus ventricosus]|uniref:Uncharacterized protein n=1 Tax=Araneus ventricosus TaxID=182803 RepID=A0A4Y2WHW8_ARAVE|nr:hypothetical protein AVEN_50670-1 [Araneus ventricosus]